MGAAPWSLLHRCYRQPGEPISHANRERERVSHFRKRAGDKYGNEERETHLWDAGWKTLVSGKNFFSISYPRSLYPLSYKYEV